MPAFTSLAQLVRDGLQAMRDKRMEILDVLGDVLAGLVLHTQLLCTIYANHVQWLRRVDRPASSRTLLSILITDWTCPRATRSTVSRASTPRPWPGISSMSGRPRADTLPWRLRWTSIF